MYVHFGKSIFSQLYLVYSPKTDINRKYRIKKPSRLQHQFLEHIIFFRKQQEFWDDLSSQLNTLLPNIFSKYIVRLKKKYFHSF